MQQYHQHFSTTKTPQIQPHPTAETPQTKMASGGFGWEVDDWTNLDRFLVLGTEGGTYYASAKKLTRASAKAVQRCIKTDGIRVVNRIVEISKGGRAAKNDPALFALAMCCKLGNQATVTAAYRALPEVARIGTHLFHWAEYCKAFGGKGGNGHKRALQRWYCHKPADRLALQLVKYQQRDGWSHRDLLRLAHPAPPTDEHNILFQWATSGWSNDPQDPEPSIDMIQDNDPLRLVIGFELAKRAQKAHEIVQLIEQHGLPRECIPTQFLNDPAVWEALMISMPVGAMIRNLGKMTSLGLVTNTSATARKIVEQLGDQDRLVKARIHPMQVLLTLKVYQQGRGIRGKLQWSPAARVIDALDQAFYLAFQAVKPTGKRLCLGLDVSGSMTAPVSGQPFLQCREATAAMALVTAAVESSYEMLAFTSGGQGHVALQATPWNCTFGVAPVSISPRQRLDDVIRTMAQYPFGGTDCALPILWAEQNKIEIDAFVIYTDSESWAGDVHVDQALRRYRDKTGIPAKLVVVAFAANNFSVANPDDRGQLDVLGLDTATPNVISDFIKFFQ